MAQHPQHPPAGPGPQAPRPMAMPAPTPMPSPMPMPTPQMPAQQMPGQAPGHQAMPQPMPSPGAPPAPQTLQPVAAPNAPLFAPHQPPGSGAATPQPPQAPPQPPAQGGYHAPMPAHPQPQQAQPMMQPAAYGAPPQAGGMPMDEEGMREGGERALPQIAIHAFCDRNDTAACIDQMGRDWRMRRTNTKIYMGGLLAAIDYYHKEKTPSLIIIESGMRGAELFNQLEQLASVCDEGTKVVIIGAANDIRLYRQLMDKGVSDYLVPPLHPLNLIRSLSDIYTDPEKPFTGRAIAFFGSKGGVGSSTLAHNMAWTLSERMMQETALIDLDSSWGTTALDFAYDSASGLEEALAEPDRLDDMLLDRIMIRHTPRLSLLPTSSSLNVTPVVDPAAYDSIINAVRSISPVAILDLPHVWNDWTSNVLTTVDDVVITSVPDLANLRNTKNLVDFLRAQRPHDTDPILVLNQTGRCQSKEDEISVENFAGAIGLDPALVIGFDPDTFVRACNEGKMLPEMKATEALTPGLDYLANRLRTGQFSTVQQETSRRGLGRRNKAVPVSDGEGGESKSLFASLLRKKS